MSFGFSVGDFLAVSHLIIKIADYARSAKTADSQYQRLVVELDGLKRGLNEIDKLDASGQMAPTVDAIKGTALACKLPLQQFAYKIEKKFEPSLGLTRSAGRLKDAEMRVRWVIGMNKAVNELAMMVNAHVRSINMLLGIYQVYVH
jgi:hypothetical protein